MKKIFPILVLLIIVAGAWYFIQSGSQAGSNTPLRSGDKLEQQQAKKVGDLSSPDLPVDPVDGSIDPEDAEDDYIDYDDRPAAEIYKTEEEALKAIEEGAKDYDDIVLEQFTEPGPDCTWCESFYATLTEKMLAPSLDEDSRSYFAEVLAISGKVEHIKTLVKAIDDAGDSDAADIYAEALELTIGGNDVVGYLTPFLDSKNELLQESAVAAVTNQGSKLAAETLYQHTVVAGDPDGYYSLGIGLAELIPEEETLPYLNELVAKRDKYSHLAVKALLNYGLEGVKIVFDSLTNSQDAVADKKMLEDAIDHVNYEDEIEAYLKKVVGTSKQPLVVEFAKEALEDFSLDDEYDDEEDEE
ncbi:hypothetical protein OAO01_04270 [Oligoflexia bacterium]|nr:hypothetical protein [Oligoflexia bacterium]